MMLIVGWLCYSGFAGLCLGMDRHYRDLIGRAPQARVCWALRLLGALLLAGGLWRAVVMADGWSMGLLHWCAGLMGSGVLLVFLLPYRPRAALGLAAVGTVLAPLVAVF
ncbi:hypothetical protein PMM47T1_17425 [Pseudomonas sp. M47T1]|uniref:DUF3325 domain-containing protein n=1 Tax=unclassified Pseudomonas TaxID=196821 RepID=UPI0002608D8E|nr:hypothetical protein PMM47T1_17425 [Pseudomonas sp. M47T1]